VYRPEVGHHGQQIVYRQLMYLAVMQSVAAALAGTRLCWHKLAGSASAAAPPVPRPASPRAWAGAVELVGATVHEWADCRSWSGAG
jgi:hypothetical protein